MNKKQVKICKRLDVSAMMKSMASLGLNVEVNEVVATITMHKVRVGAPELFTQDEVQYSIDWLQSRGLQLDCYSALANTDTPGTTQ